ncbi:MAG: hypothetical protein L3J37_10900 [Rhodobacteraceae bacterium]|nr:hypothetical protein [Paracoccaceae bacterium]
MKKLISILMILLLGTSAYLTTAQTQVCRSEGMLDEEAARIIAIATVQGENFRREIDGMRERDVSLRNDTTYDDVLADDDRTLNLAREFFIGGSHWIELHYPALSKVRNWMKS